MCLLLHSHVSAARGSTEVPYLLCYDREQKAGIVSVYITVVVTNVFPSTCAQVKKKKGDKSKKKKKSKDKDKKRSKKSSKEKKSKKSKKDVSSSSSSSSSDSDRSRGEAATNGGPVRLSDFMQS